MVVVGIMAIMAAIAVPGILHWLPNIRLQSSARNLYADMQKAKVAAVKTNADVIITYAVAAPCPGGSYTFTDNNGQVVASGVMSKGICLSSSTFTSGSSGFTPRGLPAGALGGFTLTHIDTTRTYQIVQSVAGGVRIE